MSDVLSPLRQRRIPPLDRTRTKKLTYAQWPIDAAHSSYDESLVHAREYGLNGRNYYAHARNPPYWMKADGAVDALLLRASVAKKLKSVNESLAQIGLQLFLYDAWRPRAVQAFFHDVWMPEQVRRRAPQLDEAAVIEEVERYWAAPTDRGHPAPHETGAAVDLTLVWDDGTPLYMGSLFDDVTALANTDRFEHEAFDESYSAEEARANRRLLYWTMTEAGFASHPDEWWHYSYGDQMWAALTGAPAAHYGLAAPSPDLLKA
jgi:D-alanyl-D-alanine dipeptidase